MNENRFDDYEMTEDEKVKFERLQEMIKALYVPKKVTQEELLEAMLRDEEMQQILFIRKYAYSEGKVYLLDPKLISASVVQTNLSYIDY